MKKEEIGYQLLIDSKIVGFGINRRFPFMYAKRLYGKCITVDKGYKIRVFLGSLWKASENSSGNSTIFERFIFWISQNISHELFHCFCRKEHINYVNYTDGEEKLAEDFGTWMSQYDFVKK